MAERGSELLPTTSLGQYEIRSRIGSGGMGDVYDAMHTGLSRRVAIKTLRRRFLDDDTVVTRFLREGQLASRIRHPNIVDVTDVGMIGGLPCLVMEHLEGESLGTVIKRDGAFPIPTLVDLLLPIVAAVDFAHERGVLHRDIKPSNIFLARSWNGDVTPKILDFGISKLLDESQQHGLTTDSAFVGTPHYASPEAMRAERSADGRSDQYSMGVVFYEGATGVKPYAEQGGNFVSLAMAICAGQYPLPRQVNPDLPSAFEAVIVKAMSLRAEDRFPSMRALGEALLPFASERARMIWSPTFASTGPRSAPTPQDGTQIILRPSVTARNAAGPSAHPSLAPAGTSHSGVQPTSLHPSATPPPGTHDGTPSYSLGGRSFPGSAPPKKSGGAGIAMVVGLLVATLAVVGVALVKFAGKPATAGTSADVTSAPGGSVAAPEASSYAVAIHVVPESAAFELDGVPAGTGSLSRSLPRDGRKHVLRVSAPGYETILVELDEAHPPPASVALRPAPTTLSSTTPARPGPQHGAGGAAGPGGKQGGAGKNPDNRPRTDNIDPWE